MEIRGKVRSLDCSEMYITSLDVSGNPELENLICYENANLKTITMGDVSRLKILQTTNSPVGAINISQAVNLEKLYCNNSKVPALDLTKYPRLTELNCSGNKWFRLDVSQCPELTKLFAAGCNLTKVDLSKNKKLREVQLHVNYLKALQFSAPDLHTLTLFDNEIEGKAMTDIMNSLPVFTVKDDPSIPNRAGFIVFNTENEPEPDKNKCLDTDVRIVREKNWTVFSTDAEGEVLIYEGISTLSTQAALSRSFFVYPNPAVDEIFVRNVEEGREILIFDTVGACVLRAQSTGDITRIAVEQLAPGSYFVCVDGKVETLWMK